MEAMRQSWTDDRLDAFRGETQRRFDEVDRRFDEVDRRFQEIDKRFDKVEDGVKELRGEMNTRFNALEARLDSLQRLMIWFCGAMIVALLSIVLGQGWLVITQI
jgi:tetrahydromethanopterin S-methyltransferase subunit G